LVEALPQPSQTAMLASSKSNAWVVA